MVRADESRVIGVMDKSHLFKKLAAVMFNRSSSGVAAHLLTSLLRHAKEKFHA
jgi:hypothetical protein